jgi:hypothetical protein
MGFYELGGQHPLPHLERLRPIIRYDGEDRGTVEDVHELIAALMAFPWTVSRKTPGAELLSRNGANVANAACTAASVIMSAQQLQAPWR